MVAGRRAPAAPEKDVTSFFLATQPLRAPRPCRCAAAADDDDPAAAAHGAVAIQAPFLRRKLRPGALRDMLLSWPFIIFLAAVLLGAALGLHYSGVEPEYLSHMDDRRVQGLMTQGCSGCDSGSRWCGGGVGPHYYSGVEPQCLTHMGDGWEPKFPGGTTGGTAGNSNPRVWILGFGVGEVGLAGQGVGALRCFWARHLGCTTGTLGWSRRT